MKLPLQFRSLNYPTSGFTIIELMIVIMTMTLLFGLGYASYQEFARRQQVSGALSQLKSELRLTQQLSISGTKPSSGCNILDGYELFVECSQKRYTIYPKCDGSTEPTPFKTINYPNGVTFSSSTGSNSLLFRVLGRGVGMSSSPAIITVGFTRHLTGGCASNPCGGTCPNQWLNKQTVTITESGEIF
jgi:Tfp pilus assembly protein FimT